jgi:hypothetical protein
MMTFPPASSFFAYMLNLPVSPSSKPLSPHHLLSLTQLCCCKFVLSSASHGSRLHFLQAVLLWGNSCKIPAMTPSSDMPGATRIYFDDAIDGTGDHAGGVYSVRQRSPSSTGSIRPSSLARHDSKESDLEAESNAAFDRDTKRNQVRCWFKSLLIVQHILSHISFFNFF